MTLFVPIVGMHRSGTSMVANSLGGCDLELGAHLMSGNASNLSGHWEADEAVRINDALLAASGGDWAHPPAEVRATDDAAQAIPAFLATFSAAPIAGWKDPRTTLTFAHWRPHLERFRLLACFRHPMHVAQSLALRDGRTLDEGLSLWSTYNRALLQFADGAEDVLWFDFDQPERFIRRWMRAACDSLGLTFRREAVAFNSIERHHHGGGELPAELRSLYVELAERSRQANEGLSRVASGAGATPERNANSPHRVNRAPGERPSVPARRLRRLKQKLDELTTAVQKQNAIAQQQQLDLHHTRMHVSHELAQHAAGTANAAAAIEQFRAALALQFDEQSVRLAAGAKHASDESREEIVATLGPTLHAARDELFALRAELAQSAAESRQSLAAINERGDQIAKQVDERFLARTQQFDAQAARLEAGIAQVAGQIVRAEARQTAMFAELRTRLAEIAHGLDSTANSTFEIQRQIQEPRRLTARIRKSWPFRLRRWLRAWLFAAPAQPLPRSRPLPEGIGSGAALPTSPMQTARERDAA